MSDQESFDLLDFCDGDDAPSEAASEPKAKAAHIWARDPHDWYVEPERATDALARVEAFMGPTLDPCCGGGNIVRALMRAKVNVWGSDIVHRRGMLDHERFRGVHDFLAEPDAIPGRWANIVMNPPFFRAAGAEAFIRRAYTVATAKVAAYVDIRFLCGVDRAEGLYSEIRPSRIYLIVPRVSCPPGQYLEEGGKPENGSSDWCWLVWDKTAPFVGTTTHWLNVGRGAPSQEALL